MAVTITTPEGTSPDRCPGHTCKPVAHYTWVDPTVTSVSPASGPVAGGTPITVTVTGLSPGKDETEILLGNSFATSVHCSSITECTAVSSEGKIGEQPVTVRIKTNSPERSRDNPAAVFTYE